MSTESKINHKWEKAGRTALAVLAAAIFAGTTRCEATTLTYYIDFNVASPSPLGSAQSLFTAPYSNYGDNVGGSSQTDLVENVIFQYDISLGAFGITPDITVDYSATAGSTQFRYYDANWPGVDYLQGPGGGSFYTTLTPSGGAGVSIKSFDLMTYPAGGTHAGTWTIYEDSIGGVVLDSGSYSVSAGNVYSSPLTVTTAGLDYSGPLILEINHTTGSGSNFAMDNLTFAQVAAAVPEPSTLLLLGVAGCLMRLRRK